MEDATHFQDVEDSGNALSFRNLPIHNFQSHDDRPNPSCPENDDFFEFLPDPKDPNADLLGWRSEPLTSTAAAASRPRHVSGSSYSSMKMTSPTRSKKHACIFGLPKFPPEMELSDMRRRQRHRTPAPLLWTEKDGKVVDRSGRRERHLRGCSGGAVFRCILPLV